MDDNEKQVMLEFADFVKKQEADTDLDQPDQEYECACEQCMGGWIS